MLLLDWIDAGFNLTSITTPAYNVINGINLILAIPASALTIIMAIYFFGDKVPQLKRINYFLRNKEIKVKISSVRIYPYFQENTNLVARKMRENFEINNIKFDDLTVGKNKIQILIKDFQAPYLIEFNLDISNFEGIKRTVIEIILLGTVHFRFREDSENRNYIKNIESFYKIIEKTYNVTPVHEDYVLKSTISDFEESWDRVNRVEVENGVVNIGKKVLDIHLGLITSLYDEYKRKITHI